MKLQQKLRNLTRRRGLTTKELAQLVGDVSHGTTGRWLTGESIPRLDEARRLADLFGVPLDYLARDEQEEPQNPIGEEERKILDAAKIVGYDTALRRIMNAPPEIKPEGPTYGQMVEAERREAARCKKA